MQLIVDHAQRFAKMRAHTAAHLLHAELEKIIEHTKQAGSYVDIDYLRFDFQTPRLLTTEEIYQIEKNINDLIYAALPVIKKEMSIQKATDLGAKAFFEDKYGEEVRVITIGQDDSKISVELCGGTHADNTKDIGAFKITGQEAVASGIKRITAITGPQVSKYGQEQQLYISQIAQKIGSNDKNIIEKIEKQNKDLEVLQAKYNGLQSQSFNELLTKLKDKSVAKEPFDIILDISLDDTLQSSDFKEIVSKAKDLLPKDNFLILKNDGSYAIYIGKGNISAKDRTKNNGLKGGGSDTFIQGKDPTVLNILK